MDLCRAFYAGVPEAMPEEEQDDDGYAFFNYMLSNTANVDLSFTENEIQVFNTIMKLERGFINVVDSCKDDTAAFLALISKVVFAVHVYM